jgi:hypothetical protein
MRVRATGVQPGCWEWHEVAERPVAGYPRVSPCLWYTPHSFIVTAPLDVAMLLSLIDGCAICPIDRMLILLTRSVSMLVDSNSMGWL